MIALDRMNSSLFYKRELAKDGGSDEPLVLLHGNGSSHACFDPLVPLLKDRYTIIRCDLRGFGRSAPGDEPLGLETYCDDLLHLARQLELRFFHLVGYGFGAIVAAKFAVSHPELVRKLALLSLPFVSPSQRPNGASDGNASGECPAGPVDLLANDLPSLNSGDREATFSICRKVAEWCSAYEPLDDFERLPMPTLLLCGEEKGCSPAYLALFAALSLSNYKFCTVPDSPNMVVSDQPELTGRWIAGFLSGTDGRATIRSGSPGGASRIDIQPYFDRLMRDGKSPTPPVNELKVELMRGFRVYANGTEICGGWNRRFAKSIFLYLLFRRSTRREQLCETLWPQQPLSKARRHLRVYLSHLKKMLERPDRTGGFLLLDREDVKLAGIVVCDAQVFVRNLALAAVETDTTRKRELCRSLFRVLPETLFQTIYDDWFLLLRDEWEHQLTDLAIWFADDYVRRGNPQGAFALLRQALRVLPDTDTLADKCAACSLLCIGSTEAKRGKGSVRLFIPHNARRPSFVLSLPVDAGAPKHS